VPHPTDLVFSWIGAFTGIAVVSLLDNVRGGSLGRCRAGASKRRRAPARALTAPPPLPPLAPAAPRQALWRTAHFPLLVGSFGASAVLLYGEGRRRAGWR
jgi:hypothetical protein